MTRKRVESAHIADVIAERVLQRRNGKEVRILVGRPHRSKDEWVCQFQVLGVGHDQAYALPGFDSLEALQLALGMMAVQVEAYQKKHGLTLLGGSYLGVLKPDFDAIKTEIEATPDFPRWRAGFEKVWK